MTDEHSAYERAKRRIYRQHHPDLGGSADDLYTALAELDKQFGRASHSELPEPTHVHVFSTLGPWASLRELALALLRQAREKIKPRTYFDI